jgi:hypothetical protein
MKVCLPLFYTVKFITLNASNIANIIPDSITTAIALCTKGIITLCTKGTICSIKRYIFCNF